MLRSIKNKAELQYCSLLCLKLVAINAVLAIIADGGGAIVVIYTEGEEIMYFLLYLLIVIKPFDSGLIQPLVKRLPGLGYVPPSKPWHWREKRLHHGGDVCVLVFS
jgi:hypothetical protein